MTNTLQKFCCSVGLTVALVGIVEAAFAGPITKQSTIAVATNAWVKVLTDPNGRVWYVDTTSLQGNTRFRYFWSYVVSPAPYTRSGKLVHSTAFYLSTDCQKKLFRLRFARLLDQNLKVIQEDDHGENLPLRAPIPGSGEAASLNFVCTRRR